MVPRLTERVRLAELVEAESEPAAEVGAQRAPVLLYELEERCDSPTEACAFFANSSKNRPTIC